jgi:ParB-like chromosome segregation protein Spo0J
VDIRLEDVPVARCRHSRFNTRKTRPEDQVKRLAERIGRNGFERSRAPWAVRVGEEAYEVFAGGTRLEAARLAGLPVVPLMVHEGIRDEEIARRADEDNENDEYHTPVGLLDVWAEYHRLAAEEGWKHQRIADAKGVDRTAVARRIGWHQHLPDVARKAVCDGLLDEGHLEPVSGVRCDVSHLHPGPAATKSLVD